MFLIDEYELKLLDNLFALSINHKPSIPGTVRGPATLFLSRRLAIFVAVSAVVAQTESYTPGKDNDPGVQMIMTASAMEGKAYDTSAMTCDKLVAKAAEAAGIQIVTAPFKSGTVTKSWFDHGMGPAFRQIAGGEKGITLGQLTADEVANRRRISIGSVIVTDGHAALFDGEIKVGKQIQIVILDANDSDGWTISLDGIPSQDDPNDKMIELPGHQVGYHVTRLQWGQNHLVKVFQPIAGSGQLPHSESNNIASDPHTVRLTPQSPAGERSASIVPPGNGLQKFDLYYIDTRAFAEGGTLEVDIQISPDSATDGSFDLFPPNATIPARGRPSGMLIGRHDVRRGTSTHFELRFTSGQLFVLGLDGNWFSPKGASGEVHFRVSVRR